MADEATASTATATEATATSAATETATTAAATTVLSDVAKSVATEAKATETTTEGKAAAETSKAATGDKAADGKAADGPVEYTDFTFPEGAQIDDATLGEAKAMLGEMRLPQEQAQKLVDFYANKVKAFGQAQADNWVKLNDKWVSEFKADTEIGGDSVNATVAATKKAIARFGTPKLTEALDMTGAGNHPELIRFFARVGKAISEDSFVPAAGASATAGKSAAEVLYGKQGG